MSGPIKRPIRTYWTSPGDLTTSFQPIKTVVFDCYHCGKSSRVLPDTIIDADVDMWRRRCDRMHSTISEQVKKFNNKHSTDPFEIEWLELMREIQDLIRAYKENPS